jgi:hypothetical protein
MRVVRAEKDVKLISPPYSGHVTTILTTSASISGLVVEP